MKVQPSGAVLAAATVVLGVMAGPAAFADDMDPKKIYERAAPATVQVLGKYGDGTGFIYDAEKGLIATNAHVVQGEPSLKVKVGEQPPAPVRVVGIDPCADLAVLTFTSKPPDLKSLEFGESKELEVADTVTALGYPVGISETSQKVVYTAGSVQNPNVVNAEPSTSFPRYPSTIQHSATVNPGNSGGPLLDGQGKVVGINALTVTGATQGQFYAISSDHARPILDTLAGGVVQNDPGWTIVGLDDPELGLYFEEKDATKAEAAQKRLIDSGVTGVFVINTRTNSPAGKVPLGTGDVLTAMKDTPVESVADVCDILQSSAPGERVPLEGVYSLTADGKQTKFGEAWSADLVLDKGAAPSP
ncbi:trypsin-like peptidase domain-containing protein [Streptomyces sp. NBC_01310]|uniref:S1C family serine protease n=1 Tax=Streptomyces sp. NBC_01310 TaxID=2903820 RepID=UPI0035B6236D|nr:trypsin-like peptidase domain-containing protein [Streptomyces sp. NBC_01310]